MLKRFCCYLFLCILTAFAQTGTNDPSSKAWKRLPFGTTATGSVYIPLDNWIYGAFDRLIAFGYVEGSYLGLRPWTRLSCVRQLQRSEELFAEDRVNTEARALYVALRREFEPDYLAATETTPAFHAELDSLYERSVAIAGPPVNDSFHFGQTLVNDFGRPFQEGINQIAGFQARAEYGRFSLLVRGEYQHAPAGPPQSESVSNAIAIMDENPPLPTSNRSTNTFRLLDANLSMSLAGNEISLGKSELWWAPTEGGALAYSNNAEPIYMLRMNRTEPLFVPLLSKLLGPARYDLFLGSLKGHTSPLDPWIQGQKVSFKPSANFEFGISRTIVFAGKGHVPLTLGSFWNSFTSFSNVPGSVKFSRNDPGARYSSFDFSYRLPFVRDWLTLYTDSLVHDDVSPLGAPRRAAFRPGVYLSHVPRFPHLDLRAEAVYTDFPTSRSNGGQFFYFEQVYHDAYTNKQFILGDWIGREGKGAQAWLTYHFSPQEMIQLTYRNAKSAKDFVPGGTTQNDFSVRLSHRFGEEVSFDTFAQVEFWKAPILAQGLQTDVSLSLQLTDSPRLCWPVLAKKSSAITKTRTQ